MNGVECPCENCICVAVCRHKPYDNLFQDCELLNDYEPSYKSMYSRNEDLITAIKMILNPTGWDYVYRQGYRYKEYGKKIQINTQTK